MKSRSFRVLFLVCAFTGLAAAKPAPSPTAGTEGSVYQLGSKWTRQDGISVPLSSLAGHPTVVAMVYLSCSGACPMTMTDLKKIESAVPETVRDQVRFALFSFDSKRDTPDKLREFLKSKSVDPNRWSAFQGSKVDVRKLAAVLGIQYRQDESGGFAHSNVITVLDREGRIRHQQIGLKRDPGETAAKIREILASGE